MLNQFQVHLLTLLVTRSMNRPVYKFAAEFLSSRHSRVCQLGDLLVRRSFVRGLASERKAIEKSSCGAHLVPAALISAIRSVCYTKIEQEKWQPEAEARSPCYGNGYSL